MALQELTAGDKAVEAVEAAEAAAAVAAAAVAPAVVAGVVSGQGKVPVVALDSSSSSESPSLLSWNQSSR